MGRNKSNTGGANRRRHQQAWAPYNFVPMPDKPVYADLDAQTDPNTDKQTFPIPSRHDEYTTDRHTGYFDVTLTTETPLFVRGMLTISEQESGDEIRKKSAAFSLDGRRPIIPGSSLRGMLRTMVEIVTNSKMHFVSDNKLVYRKVFGQDALAERYRHIITEPLGYKEFMYPSQLMHGGYLQKGVSPSGWVIQPAKVFQGESIVLVERTAVLDAGIREKPSLTTYKVGVPTAGRTVVAGKEGVQLHIAQVSSLVNQQNNLPTGYEPATLIISSTIGKVEENRHWYPAIFEADMAAEPIAIPQRIWDDFVKDRDLNRGIANREIKDDTQNGKSNALFYVLDKSGELSFFGPTMFFRIPYEYSIHTFIPTDLRQQNEEIDYAEALFGYVEKSNPSAYAGRISVTSAYMREDSQHYNAPFDEAFIPKILSSPKPTTFQHYLEQPYDGKAHNWETPPNQLHHYGDRGSRLRGHKLYWRQKLADLASAKDADQETPLEGIPSKNIKPRTQHTVMRPVRSKVTFKFKVYFENLSAVELGAMIWVLKLGDDAKARHQLGMGKPLGLGVVKLDPELVLIPRTESDGRYSKLFDSNGHWFTAEEYPDADRQADWVEVFKQAMGGFDNQHRIEQLMTLLRIEEPSPDFAYMQIEELDDRGQKVVDEKGRKINQYDGQPVLPYPMKALEEVNAKRKEQQRELTRNTVEQFKARVTREGLAVGDVIEGKVFDDSGKALWFSPKKVYYGEYSYSLKPPLTSIEYEAKLPRNRPIKEGDTVKGRITEIQGNRKPVILICEAVE